MTKYREGQVVQIAKDNDNEGYEKWRNRKLRITHVATNTQEHPGYDSSMEGKGLYDLEDAKTREQCPFSLYDWGIE